VIYDSKLFVI